MAELLYDTLLIDCNNLHYRSYKGDDKILTIYQNYKLETQGISGFLARLENYIKKYLKEDGKIYFLFDDAVHSNASANPRLLDYKANRKKENKQFYRSLDYVEFILSHYRDNCFILRTPIVEADDWVKPVLKMLPKESKNLMITTDLDWTRSLSENTHWFSHHKKRVYTPLEFEQDYGFKPTESSVTFYKIFYGDESDNLKGIYPQMSPAKFKYVIENFKSIKEFLFACRTKSIPLFESENNGIYNRMEKNIAKMINLWEITSYKKIPREMVHKHIVETKVNMLKLNMMYKALNLKDLNF